MSFRSRSPSAVRARPREADGRRSWRFLALYALANAGGVAAFLPLLTLLLPLKVQAAAGDDRLTTLTLCALAGAVAASLSNVLFGALSDRSFARHRNRRGWIAAGLAATIASYPLLHWAASPAEIVVAVLAFQAAVNMLLAPLYTMMADEVPDSQKGIAGGLLTLGNPIGSALAAVLVATGFGEGGRFALLCGFIAACVVPILFVPARPADTTPPPAPARAIRRGDLALTWGSRLLVQLAGNVLFTYLLFYFESVVPGEDPTVLAPRVGHVTTIVFIISIPIALAVGRASDRLRARKPFLMLAASATAVGLVVMALLPDWTSAVVGYGMYAIGTAIFLGLHSAYAMQILPSPEHRGRDLGILNLTNTLPALLGPALTWALATTERFTPALLTLAVLTLLGGALVLPVRSER